MREKPQTKPPKSARAKPSARPTHKRKAGHHLARPGGDQAETLPKVGPHPQRRSGAKRNELTEPAYRLEVRLLFNHEGEKRMRIDLLQLIRRLLGILSAAAAVAETIQGVIGQPTTGRRAGDAQLQQLAQDAITASPSGPAKPPPPPPPADVAAPPAGPIAQAVTQ